MGTMETMKEMRRISEQLGPLTLTFTSGEEPPTLEEAQTFVGGYVELVNLPDGSELLVNEDGLSQQLGYNAFASGLTQHQHRIVGNAIHLIGGACWKNLRDDS